MTRQKMPPAKLVRVIERARHSFGRLHQRTAPPPPAMLDKIFGAWIAQGIAVAADLKVADALAAGPLPIDELARRAAATEAARHERMGLSGRTTRARCDLQ